MLRKGFIFVFLLTSLFLFSRFTSDIRAGVAPNCNNASGGCYLPAGVGIGSDGIFCNNPHWSTCASGYYCTTVGQVVGECVKGTVTQSGPTATPYSSPKATPINKCASECIRDDAPPGCAAGSTAATDCGSCGLDQFGAAKICCKPNSCTTTATTPPTNVVNGACASDYKVVCGTGTSCVTTCSFPNHFKDEVNACGHRTDGSPMYACLQCSCQKITSTPTPTPVTRFTPSSSTSSSKPVVGSCNSTKIYTTGWTEITPIAFQGLTSGIQVYFCVNGITSSSSFDKARFTINGVLRPETSIVRQKTNDYCDLYTIPANTYSFKVQGEIHHATLGWL